MRLLLIRHGETPNNLLGALDTAAPGAGLTERGHTQAQAIPEALAEESIGGLYVSGLVRTHLTAAPLAGARELEPRVDDRLNEIVAGDYEMHTSREAVEAYIGCAYRWGEGDLEPGLPGGENGHEFRARYFGAIADIAEAHGDHETVAVVSHGASIRVFAAMVTDLGAAGIDDFGLGNTGMVSLIGSPTRGWDLDAWVNDPIGGAHLAGPGWHDVTAEPDATPLGAAD